MFLGLFNLKWQGLEGALVFQNVVGKGGVQKKSNVGMDERSSEYHLK